MKTKESRRKRRQEHIRKTVSGTTERPRLSIYRSNAHIYAQLIDDVQGTTLAQANDTDIKTGTPVEKANKVGQEIAKAAKAKKISQVVFDRGGYKYHGRVKSLADGAREGGLEF